MKFNQAECVSSDDTNSNGRLAFLTDGSQLPGSRKIGKVLLKGMSREKCSLRVDADLFFLGIQPNCLNVHSYSASGLAQVKGFSSSRHTRQRINSSFLFHFAVVTAPIVF